MVMSLRQLENDIEGLADLPREELIEVWSKLMGSLPFKGARHVTLVRGVAYKLQEKRTGKLKTTKHRQFLKIAQLAFEGEGEGEGVMMHNTRSKSCCTNKRVPTKLQTGSKLIREWNGRTYEVEVVDKGFLLNDEQYKSLSACAKAITGAHWSGPRFFGAEV